MTRHQLKIVVPVSLSDVHLLEGWVNAFRAVGGAKNHPLEFYPTPSTVAAAKEAAQAVKNFCFSVDLTATDQDWTYGWPRACNAHWGFVTRSLAMKRNTLPWLWCELDMNPLANDWADQLIQEYVMTGGRGQMGVIMPMVKIRDEGKPTESFHIDKADLYMVGAGIYDPGYFHLLGGMGDNVWKNPKPFDHHLRHYAKTAWRSTSLISSAARTINYRHEGEEVVMDDLPDKKEYELRAGSVPRGTILHHGCKDSSLAKMIVAASGRPWQTIDDILLNMEAEVPKAAPEPTPAPPSVLPAGQRKAEPHSHSDKKLAAAFAAAKAQHPEPKRQPAPESSPEPTPAPPPVDPAVLASYKAAEETSGEGGDLPAVTVEDIAKAISEASKPMNVSSMAAHFGTTEDHIKNLAKKPESKVNIVGGVWMKMAR